MRSCVKHGKGPDCGIDGGPGVAMAYAKILDGFGIGNLQSRGGVNRDGFGLSCNERVVGGSGSGSVVLIDAPYGKVRVLARKLKHG